MVQYQMDLTDKKQAALSGNLTAELETDGTLLIKVTANEKDEDPLFILTRQETVKLRDFLFTYIAPF